MGLTLDQFLLISGNNIALIGLVLACVKLAIYLIDRNNKKR